MANHKSSLKRIRQEETRRLHNRYYGKTMRNAVRKLRATTDKAEAVAMYPGITKMLDKLAKVNIIHKNKASNLKSKLALYGSVGGYGASDSCAAVYGMFLLGIIACIGAIRLAFVVVDVACVHELSSALLAGEVVRTSFFF